MIAIQLASLAEALVVERALISRAVSLENLAKESFRRAPEYPELCQEYEAKAQELRHLAEEIGSQAIQQAKGERRDTDVSALSEASYLSLISQP
jgi:hypothetical protein